jgi:hypothetical protein
MDNSWSGRRDHLFFLFLYNTGARVSEALSVQVQDVRREDYRTVQLLGKGRRQRMVPLWKETAQHIRAWLKLAGLKLDQYLLLNSLRKAHDSDRRSAKASIARPSRSGDLPVAALSPHFPSHHSPLSTLPDYVEYPCANPVFSANARSRTRHSIDAFHQPHWKAKESTAKCIIASRVLPPSAAGPPRRHRSPRFQGHGRAGNRLGPDSANDPSPPEESVADIRLCRAMLGLCTRRFGISGLNPQKLSITRHNPEG